MASSVDGCGCGVLEHRYGLDVIGIEAVDVAFHIVNEDERASSIDGEVTSDAE